MSFHKSMRKAAIATSCDPQSEISEVEVKKVVEEGEDSGKLDS